MRYKRRNFFNNDTKCKIKFIGAKTKKIQEQKNYLSINNI